MRVCSRCGNRHPASEDCPPRDWRQEPGESAPKSERVGHIPKYKPPSEAPPRFFQPPIPDLDIPSSQRPPVASEPSIDDVLLKHEVAPAAPELDATIKQLLRSGAFEQAATLLADAGRFADAGHMLLDGLGVGISMISGLATEQRAIAAKAADWLESAGELRAAAKILRELGETARAELLFERAGGPGSSFPPPPKRDK